MAQGGHQGVGLGETAVPGSRWGQGRAAGRSKAPQHTLAWWAAVRDRGLAVTGVDLACPGHRRSARSGQVSVCQLSVAPARLGRGAAAGLDHLPHRGVPTGRLRCQALGQAPHLWPRACTPRAPKD